MARSLLIGDAAEILGVCRRTVYYWIRDGRLRTVTTIGGSKRVTVDSIEEVLRGRFPKARIVVASGTNPSVIFQEP